MPAALSIPLPADPATSDLAEAAQAAARDKKATLLTREGVPVAAVVPIEDLEAPEGVTRAVEALAQILDHLWESLSAAASREGPGSPSAEAIGRLEATFESLADDIDALAVRTTRARWALHGRERGIALEDYAASHGIALSAPE